MKPIIIFLLFVSLTDLISGQSLQRDNLLGLHTLEVELNEGVSLDEFRAFFVERVIPTYEKHWLGLKGHIVQSVRGEFQGKLGLIWVFATEPTRDYYFNEDGTPNERELEAFDRVEAIEQELRERYGSYTVNYRDDWVVK